MISLQAGSRAVLTITSAAPNPAYTIREGWIVGVLRLRGEVADVWITPTEFPAFALKIPSCYLRPVSS